jgi:ligand-binding sensor domain-containing protein
LIFSTDLSAEINKANLQRNYPVLQADNQLWIGTPSGLYQYIPDDDSFKRFTIPSAGQNFEVEQLYFYDEWLWCVLDSGLAILHVRLNEWLYFDSKNGLPSDKIHGVGFAGDYAWIATDNGAARFDLLIEEWETYDEARGLPGKRVEDIKTIANQVWMITEEGFAEYDPDFEKLFHPLKQVSLMKKKMAKKS